MPARRTLQLRFPAGGLNKNQGYQDQPPYTTPDCNNVRLQDSQEGRERGGTRPGLGKSHGQQISGGSNKINMLAVARPTTASYGELYVPFDQADDSDIFNAPGWAYATWLGSDTAIELEVDTNPAGPWPTNTYIRPAEGVDDETTYGVVYDGLDIDTAYPMSVTLECCPFVAATTYFKAHQIYLAMNNGSPIVTTDGIFIEWTCNTVGAWTLTVKSYTATVLKNTWTDTGTGYPKSVTCNLKAIYDEANHTIKVYMNNDLKISEDLADGGDLGVSSETTIGFGLERDGNTACALSLTANYRHTAVSQAYEQTLVASADGEIWQDNGSIMEQTVDGTAINLSSDRLLHAVRRAGKLYIADHNDTIYDSGTDGETNAGVLDDPGAPGQDWTTLGLDAYNYVAELTAGTSTTTGVYVIDTVHATNGVTLTGNSDTSGAADVTYRILRGPKVYDPVAGTLSAWVSGVDGEFMPLGCPLIARYRDRIVLGGAADFPHIWYMSRQGDPNDFDYSENLSDPARAVAGTSTQMGVIADPLTALIAFSDDYMIFGCEESLWRLRGDPARGGQIDNISQTIGIIDRAAWCRTPEGAIIFLSRDGLYLLAPGATGVPQPLSRDVLPNDLVDINLDNWIVHMVYDVRDRGIHIFQSPVTSGNTLHYWFDWRTKTFWPFSFSDTDHNPCSVTSYDLGGSDATEVLMGGEDGYIRRFDNGATNDDSAALLSYILYGPFRSPVGGSEVKVNRISGVLDNSSGDVTWSLFMGDNPESAVYTTASATGTWVAGVNYDSRPKSRGVACFVRIEASSFSLWQMERIDIELLDAGRTRFM